jgi:hypothetical protein
MYKGEGSRPNTLTVALTLNGASLSCDMAQRCVITKLSRPLYDPSWKEDTIALIEAKRWKIIADCVSRLREVGKQLSRASRWSAWEFGVLSHVAEPADCQRVILERQQEVDDDTSEADIVRDSFAMKLIAKGRRPESSHVFIPAADVAVWLNEATGDRRAVTRAGAYLNQLGIQSLRRGKFDGKRGFFWKGPESCGVDAERLHH